MAGSPRARSAIRAARATLTALFLSARRRIPVALVATLRRVIALRPALVPVAVSLVVALLTFLAALLSTRILRTTLVLIARHVSISALLVSLIRLCHWFLLGRLRGRPDKSKLGAELIIVTDLQSFSSAFRRPASHWTAVTVADRYRLFKSF
jgi:hypothetical protein